MFPIKSFLGLLLAFLSVAMISCGEDEITEPAVLTDKQIRRLLTGNDTKLWQQSTQYYLEDSCTTGSYIRFTENTGKNSKLPFDAYFLRDPSICTLVADTIPLQHFNEKLPKDSFLIIQKEPFLQKKVMVLLNPQFQTTDSLLFAGLPQDSVWYKPTEKDSTFLYTTPAPDTVIRRIRLLTSEQLIMDVLGPEKQFLFREEYKAVKEPVTGE